MMCVAGVAFILFLIISVIASIQMTKRRRASIGRYHYRPRKQLMVGNERRCFQLLNDIFGQKFYIIPSVSLEALLNHRVGGQNREEAYGFINNKIVDFVFCNKRTLRPVCAVKLDDSSVKDRSPGADPKDMEKFFRSAHLPFVRITNPKTVSREAIIEEFSRVVYETSITPPDIPPSKEEWEKSAEF